MPTPRVKCLGSGAAKWRAPAPLILLPAPSPPLPGVAPVTRTLVPVLVIQSGWDTDTCDARDSARVTCRGDGPNELVGASSSLFSHSRSPLLLALWLELTLQCSSRCGRRESGNRLLDCLISPILHHCAVLSLSHIEVIVYNCTVRPSRADQPFGVRCCQIRS